MDIALKHRLTGAVILVLLAVLLLPELLTGSGEAGKARSGATSASANGERRIEVDLTESATAPAASMPQANPAPPIELPVPAAPVAQAAPAPEVAPVPEAAPLAEAKPEPKPAAKPATGSYYVQIGVFVNVASARRLERQLRDQKFAAVVDEITRSGKRMFRVRVGPEVDRAAANALANKLADAGHKGSVVK